MPAACVTGRIRAKPRNTPGAQTANFDKEKRTPRGLAAHRARRVALNVRPRARSWCARTPPARGRSEGAARAERQTGREQNQERQGHHSARERPCSTATARTTHARRTRAAGRIARASPVAMQARRSLAPYGAATEETTRDKDDDDRRQDESRPKNGKDTTAREKSALLDCGGENHPRTTHARRRPHRARIPLRGASAPLDRSVRSGDRRDDARQGRRRPATGREQTQERQGHHSAREIGPARLRRREPPTHDARAPPAASATAADRIRRLRRRRRRRRHLARRRRRHCPRHSRASRRECRECRSAHSARRARRARELSPPRDRPLDRQTDRPSDLFACALLSNREIGEVPQGGWWRRGGTHTTTTTTRTNLQALVVHRACCRGAVAVGARCRRPRTCAHVGYQLHYRRTSIDYLIIVTW